MKRITLNITSNNDVADMGEMYHLTLCDVDNEKVVLELDEKQIALIESRLTRSFYIRCKKERILQEITDAGNSRELEAIAAKYYLCDACNFNGINPVGVKRILNVVVDTLYKYPRLRSKLCFIGTHYELEKLIVKMEQGDADVLNAFGLQYICTGENAKKLGGIMHHIVTRQMAAHEGYVAMAMCAFGLFDSILLDKNDYDGYVYLEFVKQLRRNEAMGYHPKGCHSPESVIYHELGHLLDDMCGSFEDKELLAYYKSLSEDDIKEGLSEYALTSVKEFIAEAFSEFMCSATPRPIAKRVGELQDKLYRGQ